jgi:hypothetical protein
MAGRHQAELAIELAQSRFRQAFDMRLPIIPFCAFVSDQQMAPSLKGVFESLASGNLYRVRLYDTPIRQSATRDIVRRDLDDRSRRGKNPGKADADITHCCSWYGHWLSSSAGHCLMERMAMMVGSRRYQSGRRRSQMERPRLPFGARNARVSGWIFGAIKLAFRQLNSILFQAGLRGPRPGERQGCAKVFVKIRARNLKSAAS